MTYNIHPIFVHFPIALLTIYSLIRVIPVARWMPQVKWRDIERVLLAIGVLGAFAGLATGETAEHLTHPNHQLVEMHALFASLSTWLYGALLTGEAVAIYNVRSWAIRFPFVTNITRLLERILCNETLSILIAFVALISIGITGLLGGVMVYGISADPLATVVLRLFGISF